MPRRWRGCATAPMTIRSRCWGPMTGQPGARSAPSSPIATQLRALQDGTEATTPATGRGCAGRVRGRPARGRAAYRLEARNSEGTTWVYDDPLSLRPGSGRYRRIPDRRSATHYRLWDALGGACHDPMRACRAPISRSGRRMRGVVLGRGRFQRVGRAPPPRCAGAAPRAYGELFLPAISEGAVYKYEILGHDGVVQPLKADPVGLRLAARARERLGRAADRRLMAGPNRGLDGDPRGQERPHRADLHLRGAPRLVAAQGRRAPDLLRGGRAGTCRLRLGDGIHPLSSFCRSPNIPSTRHGATSRWAFSRPPSGTVPPHEFRDLIAAAHDKGLGVILDWVPGHFPSDAHGLARFDGTAL